MLDVLEKENITVREKLLEKIVNGHKKPERIDKWEMLHQHPPANRFGKRLADLALGLAGGLALALLYPFIALGIKLSSRGPVIFKQKRTGQYGRAFICYKFRTMHFHPVKVDNTKPDVTRKNDPRVFWFASVLRKTNLDELPQAINVLKGEMSVVGPRPYPVKECIYWNNLFSDFYLRYRYKPGLTGLAQVQGYRGGTYDVAHMRTRLDCDLKYIRSHSLLLDVKIMIKTVIQMLHLDTNGH